jgi:drug/metabolite transporter (DMT)-like permease
LWILLLWAGLALTLNHSLAWLQSRLMLAAVLGGVSSPLSYLAAERLGAVDIVTESGVWFIGLGLSWAVALPLLLWLASHFKHLKQENSLPPL